MRLLEKNILAKSINIVSIDYLQVVNLLSYMYSAGGYQTSYFTILQLDNATTAYYVLCTDHGSVILTFYFHVQIKGILNWSTISSKAPPKSDLLIMLQSNK